jgi:uncharacterized repeat protein (TIGR01451 family)
MRKPARLSAILSLLLAAPLALEAAHLVSVNSTNDGAGNGPSRRPQASFAGDWVVFESDATNLVSPGTAGTNIFVRNTVGQYTTLISVNSAGLGVAGNGPSIKPRIAIDSLRIVFESDATDLVSPATSGHQLFARLAYSGPTTLVSVNSTGNGPGNGTSHDAVITPDGRYVVFLSNATNLVSGVAANGLDQVYIRDLQAGVTKMVSVDSSGLAAGGLPSLLPLSVSDDGRYVAFTSNAILLSNDTNGFSDVYVRDVTGATTSLVSQSQITSLSGNGASFGGQISRDGSVVLYTTRATNLQTLINDLNGVEDVYLWYRTGGFSQLVSSRRSDDAFTGNGVSTTADGGNFLSYSGFEFAFRSTTTDVATGIAYPSVRSNIIDVNSSDGFGYNVDSADPTYTNAGDVDSNGPISLSYFGDVVAYQSSATNLSPGDTNDLIDVFAHVRSTNVNQMASRGLSGSSGNGNSTEPYASDDGRFVVFSSRASDLDLLDTNGAVQDVFEQRICSGFLVDRQDDADAASPGTPACLAVGGGCTLRAAVDAANANGGGLICLPAGTYPLDLGTIDIKSGVTIDGDGNTSTIIDGQFGSQVFDVFDPNNSARTKKKRVDRTRRTSQSFNATIENLQIVNGFSSGDGGAIEVEVGTALYVNFVTFDNNRASEGSGGAIAAYAGSELHVFGSEFDNNSAFDQGGAVWCDGLLDMTANRFRCNVSGTGSSSCGNTGRFAPRRESSSAATRPRKPAESFLGDGGAVWVGDDNVDGNQNQIVDAEFFNNAAGRLGGAVYVLNNAILTLDRVTVAHNDDGIGGGGIYNSGSLTLKNGTITGNTRNGLPGVGFGNGTVGQTAIVNSTISRNSSGPDGMEVENSGSSLNIVNSVVDGDNTCSGSIVSLGHNIENHGTCGFTAAGDLQNTNPKLDPNLQYNGGFEQTILLLPGSPAIDAGDDASCPPTDERGVARPQGAHCDMGSVEMIGITISDVSMAEGNSGTTNFVFTVTLSAPNPNTISVDYATADGTATLADNDYIQTSGTLVFGFLEQVRTITVPVVGDVKLEPNETFFVNLSNPTSGSIIVDNQGVGTIVNDDVVSADVQVSKIGPATVQLGQQVVYTVSVHNAGPSDAVAVVVSDTTPPGLTFVSNAGACLIAYPCNLGTVNNGQTMTITSTYLVPGGYNGPSTIFNTASASSTTADPVPANNSSTASTEVASLLPSLSIGSVSVLKPASGTVAAVFPVTMSSPSASDVVVSYASVDGTAHAGTDYQGVSSILTIPAGAATASITVLVNGNTIASGDKSFTVFLFNPSNAVIEKGAGAGTGRILDRTPLPSLSIGDVSVAPGVSGTTPAVFPVTLSGATSRTVTVNYSTADGTATAGNNDYLSTSGTLSFAPGETSKTIAVQVVGKPFVVPSNFFVDLSAAANATVARPRGTGSISRAFPSLSVGDAAVQAPDSASGAAVQAPGASPGSAVFSVTLSVASTQTVTVSFTTADRTAFAGIDYTATNGVLTFAPGETAKSVTVAILPGGTVFPTKVFELILSNPTGAILSKSLGEAAIFDRSKPLPPGPYIYIDDLSVVRPGSSFALWASVPVRLTGPSTATISLSYATSDGTAHAGTDYLPTFGTLTIAPGETMKKILVPVLREPAGTPARKFKVSIASSFFADVIVAPEGIVSILPPAP